MVSLIYSQITFEHKSILLQTSVREVFTGFELTILNTDDGAFYLGYYKGDPHSTLVSVPDPTFPRDITYHGYMGARTFGAVRLGKALFSYYLTGKVISI